MVSNINKDDVIEVLTQFSRKIVDNYTLNLEKVKSIEIVQTESDTDSEVEKEEIISYHAKISFNYDKMSKELASDKMVKVLVNLFNIKFNFNNKQKENNFIRMKSRLKNVLGQIKKMDLNIEINESTSITEIKDKITEKFVKNFLDNGIIEQLKYTVDEMRPYKFLGIILVILIIIVLLYYLINFIINKFQVNELSLINNSKIKNIYN